MEEVCLSYYQGETDKKFVDFVNGLKQSLKDKYVPIFKTPDLSQREFNDKLYVAKYVICILSDGYFKDDFCMANWINLHEEKINRFIQKIIYIKYDEEVISIDTPKARLHGFQFDNPQYVNYINDYWKFIQTEVNKNHTDIDDTKTFLYSNDQIYTYLNSVGKIIRNGVFYEMSNVTNENIIKLIEEKKQKNDLKSESFPQKKLFISSSSQNKEKRLNDILDTVSCVEYWHFERSDRFLAEKFNSEITYILDKCELVLFVSSQNSNRKNKSKQIKESWCVKEIKYALKAKKDIIVLKLDDTPFHKKIEELVTLHAISITEENWRKQLTDFINPQKRNSDRNRKTNEDANKKNNDKESYTIYYEIDNEVIYKQNISTGSEIILIDAPKKEGYTFSGWQCKYKTMPAHDIIVSSCFVNQPKPIKWKRAIAFATTLILIAALVYYFFRPGNEYFEPKYVGNKLERVSPLEVGDNGVFSVREGTTEIGVAAFDCCSEIKEVKIPQSVGSISAYAFHGCKNLERINMPNRLIEIGNFAFDSCVSLKHLKINGSTRIIGYNPFANILGMTISVDDENEYYSDYEGKYLIEKKNNRIISYVGNEKEIHIPNGIRIIGFNAFYQNLNIQKIFLDGSNVIDIENYAFQNCTNINYIKFPDSLSSIGDNPFMGVHISLDRTDGYWRSKDKDISFVCDEGYLVDIKHERLICYFGNRKQIDLVNRYMPNNDDKITKIGDFAFYCCEIESINCDTSIVYDVASNAFQGCNNEEKLIKQLTKQ